MLGFRNLTGIHHNLSPIQLVEQAIARNEGWLSEHAVFIAHTGMHTGRSAKDKFVVDHPDSSPEIWWDSPYQKKLEPQKFQNLLEDVLEHFEDSDPFVLDAFAGADHYIGLAQSVCPQHVHSGHTTRGPSVRTRLDGDLRPEF
jgi:phosphoenolpyruvate carboxykinase (ATP)